MDVSDELHRLGGVATRQALVAATSRRELETALESGEIVRLARGRYALAQVDDALAAAFALTATLCLASAALRHGWAVKTIPERPQVALPRNRKVSPGTLAKVDPHWLRLGPDDVRDGATTADRTLLDCLRQLPFDEALAIVDSALRAGYAKARLRALVRDARGPGSARMGAIVELADGDAANPFESVLRAIALSVPGLTVRPQVSLHRRTAAVVGGGDFLGRPDLVDDHLRIVVEADSFEWHGGRAALCADARRYNAFVVDGWLVLRFSWEDVMFHADDVRAVLVAAVAERTERLCPVCRTAS